MFPLVWSCQIPLISCIFYSDQIPLISCIFFPLKFRSFLAFFVPLKFRSFLAFFFYRFRSFRSNSAHSGHLLHFFERNLSGLLDLGNKSLMACFKSALSQNAGVSKLQLVLCLIYKRIQCIKNFKSYLKI